MERQSLGAYSPFAFGRETSSDEMDFETSSPGAYVEAHPHQHLSSHQSPYGNPSTFSSPFVFPMNHPTMNLQGGSFHSHQRHHSASAQSNHSSVHRSSDGSVFSSWQPRSSVASTDTTWSHFSDLSSEQCIAQTEVLEAQSPVASLPSTRTPFRRTHERQPSQDREPFLTCVSRNKRSRRSTKEPKYQCTACSEGFQQKYDWKRHEETYQERTEMFECDLCLNVYFLEKDFIHHHQGSHRCQVCVPKRHVEMARKKRIARTGWGCGFCVHFSMSWQERCNHISEHFEKKGHTMADWKHSRVIWSLLQRPDILQEWCFLLETKQRTQNPFSWKESTTGRSEGYPDTDVQPQLQDLLEFYPQSHDAAAIARLAFETGLRGMESPKAPPPVPKKDQYPSQPPQQSMFSQRQHSAPFSAAVYDHMTESPIWNRLGAIPEDPFQPTNVVMLGYDALNAAFNNTYDHTGQF
ncbi:hypothetical protein P171DRAFT_79222 [Karstenula rhodostoma CBS 690.94]|uniref:C2H2-type domain-containing protein n=1 Tax=Karstenula rhodostoma CBS 690.94 TaxID=1392251 RepID=A0A9P4UA68_9PLEO|nr:hypothetical protein P171DRAFT_79222 [Karstenula rhodostoma CBS 690.94]